MTGVRDDAAIVDLIAFARIELAARDVEPWADLIAELHRAGELDAEQAAWVVKLYNAYDDFGSAWSVYRRWAGPLEWYCAPDLAEAAEFPCTQERRNLRGGRVLKHLGDYASRLAGDKQTAWLGRALTGDDPGGNFTRLSAHMRSVWGVGRQTAFEWAEFAEKVLNLPVTAPDAQLWESEGPRRSLQRLYGNPTPDPHWLEEAAVRCLGTLAEAGMPLLWEDFETIICDFNVARDGRYYPGKHLAALRAEIATAPHDDQPMLDAAFRAVVPEPWASIAPGIDKAKLAVYRDTGTIVDRPDWEPK